MTRRDDHVTRTISLQLERLPLPNTERQLGLKIHIRDDQVAPWCLELCLLDQGLSDAVHVTGANGAPELQISVDRKLRRETGRVEWLPAGVHLRISVTELGAWLGYFLRWYRDGMAEASHIDVDIAATSWTKGLALILMATNTHPPLSPEEARRTRKRGG